MIMLLQQNNTSNLHALTNAYVTCHEEDPMPHPVPPEISKIPTIVLLDTSYSSESDDRASSGEEELNTSPEFCDELDSTVEERDNFLL